MFTLVGEKRMTEPSMAEAVVLILCSFADKIRICIIFENKKWFPINYNGLVSAFFAYAMHFNGCPMRKFMAKAENSSIIIIIIVIITLHLQCCQTPVEHIVQWLLLLFTCTYLLRKIGTARNENTPQKKTQIIGSRFKSPPLRSTYKYLLQHPFLVLCSVRRKLQMRKLKWN